MNLPTRGLGGTNLPTSGLGAGASAATNKTAADSATLVEQAALTVQWVASDSATLAEATQLALELFAADGAQAAEASAIAIEAATTDSAILAEESAVAASGVVPPAPEEPFTGLGIASIGSGPAERTYRRNNPPRIAWAHRRRVTRQAARLRAHSGHAISRSLLTRAGAAPIPIVRSLGTVTPLAKAALGARRSHPYKTRFTAAVTLGAEHSLVLAHAATQAPTERWVRKRENQRRAALVLLALEA